jgi:hypothetical protein
MMTKVANVSTFVKANLFDTVLTPEKLKFSDNGVLLREQSWHLPMQIVISSAVSGHHWGTPQRCVKEKVQLFYYRSFDHMMVRL